MKYKRVLIKLSGQALAGEQRFGFDPSMLDFLTKELIKVHEQGVQVGIVIGGGNFIRGGANTIKGVNRSAADYMGMLATIINGSMLKEVFNAQGLETRVMSAIPISQIAEPYIKDIAIKHLKKNRVVIFTGGTGNPWFTTDTAAALRALEIKAELLVKSTRVNGVYSSDPETDSNAQFYKSITYREVLNLGLKFMDATAISLCMDGFIPVRVVNVSKKDILLKVVEGADEGSLVYGGNNE